MKSKLVIAKDVFTSEDTHLLSEKSYDVLVCNELKTNLKLPDSIRVFFADRYRIEGSWLTYKHNTDVVSRLVKAFPNAFKCLGYDICPALPKLIYWTNYRAGSVKACLNAEFSSAQVNDLTSFSFLPKWKGIVKSIVKYSKLCFNYFKPNLSPKSAAVNKGQIGILVNDEFEWVLYAELVDLLKQHALIVFHYGNIDVKLLNDPQIQFVNIASIQSFSFPKWINPFVLDKDELHVYNEVLNQWSFISSELIRYEWIKNTGIEKLIFNEGENRPSRNLLKTVLENHVVLFNTMNGIKAGEAQDADVNFDQWLIWDDSMKDLLIKSCHLPASMLSVVGHLAEDKVANHRFINSLGINLKELKTKKVITVFSVKGNRKEKQDLKSFLEDLISAREDIFIFIKPHPLERQSDYLFSKSIGNRLFVVPEEFKNNKSVLYDLLFLSDLSIVFGSTVALESNWMNTPCVTLEYRNKALIPQDGDHIVHHQSIDQLSELIRQLDKKPNFVSKPNRQSVASRIYNVVKKTVALSLKKKTNLTT